MQGALAHASRGGMCAPSCSTSASSATHQLRQTPRRAGCRARLESQLRAASVLPDAALALNIAAASTSSSSAAAAAAPAAAADMAAKVRPHVPILHQEVNGRPLVYLDNAATSQKPIEVLDAMDRYYRQNNSNVHRGVHHLSAQATADYEASRDKVAEFINANSRREIVFVRNASEAINLVACTWGAQNIGPGDEIISSVAEHHSNLVPWQLLAARTGAVIKHVRLTDTQELDMEHLKELVTPRTKLISLVHVSNMLGCVLDMETVVAQAKAVGARVLLDACQSVPNMPVDVQSLGVDWVVASGHKMLAPTGIGFLWGRYDVLETMQPWMGGGEMIQDVFLDHSTFALPPARFEAGTPDIAGAIGLGAACDYLTRLGMGEVHAYERQIGTYLYDRLSAVDGVTIYGPPPTAPRGRASLCAFNVDGLHATDVSTLLDTMGVAVRSGHHCTQPLHRHLGIPASARASLYMYNTTADVDAFVDALQETVGFFKEMEQ